MKREKPIGALENAKKDFLKKYSNFTFQVILNEM